MDYGYSELIDEAASWAAKARGEGWLTEEDLEPLRAVDARSPASLFPAQGQRPLVVAFFGGTGVGKSTLLNRLAGKEIARTGVVRPTSREVTLYLHHSLHISQLPADFPVEKVRLAQHDDDRRKDILWVDMPDIDSTEQSNHEIVLEWLPHIDVVVYVVSPERYRDDKGWRLLLSHGHRHAWLFVINQWDRGEEAQFDDFRRLIVKAGFRDPIILRSACTQEGGGRVREDFGALNATIQALADANTVRQMELRDVRRRLSELSRALRLCTERFGAQAALDALTERWEQLWRETVESLDKGLEWPIRQIASAYVTDQVRLLGRLRRGADDGDQTAKGNPLSGLWDDWAQTRVEDALEQVVIEGDARAIPAAPLKSFIEALKGEAKKKILMRMEHSLRESLSNPGNALQRFFLKFTGICATLLPLAAIGWVSYLAFDSYYTSSMTGKPFLGADFAIHSAILIAVSWLLPYFLYRKLRPSSEKAALRGLKKGLSAAFGALEGEVAAGIMELRRRRARLLETVEALISRCEMLQRTSQGEAQDNELLARMVLNDRTSAPASGSRG